MNILTELGCTYPEQTDCYACLARMHCVWVHQGKALRDVQRQIDAEQTRAVAEAARPWRRLAEDIITLARALLAREEQP